MYTDSITLIPDSLFLGFSSCLLYWGISNFQILTGCVSLNLAPFVNFILPLIELFSKLLRSINLSLRLGTNFNAGHIIIIILTTWVEILFFSKN